MTRKPVNLPASIATRLRNLAAVRKTDMAFVFRRYAIERLLYRLSVSDYKDKFVVRIRRNAQDICLPFVTIE